MKNKLKSTLLLTLSVMVWSCNELPKKAQDIEKVVAKSEKAQEKQEKVKLYERLKNTQPVSADALEDWVPKSLGGLTLERTKSLGMFGEDVAMAGWYKRQEDKNIILYIYDAAGPDGTMISDKIDVLGTEKEYDVETQQHSSVTVKGRMARQVYETEKNMTIISFFHEKRFMLMITAHGHSVDETWALVDELDFDALNDLIK